MQQSPAFARAVRFSAFASTLALAASLPALAGPSWDVDYETDAGQTATTAQIITSSLSPTIVVSGRLTGYGLVGSDFVDMYGLNLSAQTMVTISTAGESIGGSANFDTQLFLFRRKGGNGNNIRAVALKGNNDAGLGNSGSRIGEESNPGSTSVLLGPGFYYIAISGVGTTAFIDGGGLIWPSLGNPGQTVGGNDRFLEDWVGEGQVGDYSIRLQSMNGGGALPSPGALALLGLSMLGARRRRRG